MNLKGFFVASLSSALDLGIATPDDVVRYITPEVLAEHLPRPLWARLLTACLGAPRVDAQLVVETIGVPNLCEHVPSKIVWACLAEVGARSLGGALPVAVPRPISTVGLGSKPIPLATPPPPDVLPPPATPSKTPLPSVLGGAIPAPGTAGAASASGTASAAGAASAEIADVVAALEADDRQSSPGGRARSASQRFRQSSTGIGRLAGNQRRPQAQAGAPTEPSPIVPSAAAPVAPRGRRSGTEADVDEHVQTDDKDDWQSALAVEDEQLVDWQASEETVTTGDEYNRRK